MIKFKHHKHWDDDNPTKKEGKSFCLDLCFPFSKTMNAEKWSYGVFKC